MNLVWVNGEQTKHIDVRDRGLAYGDGLFETMLLTSVAGEPCVPLLARHMQRLTYGLKRLGFGQLETLLDSVKSDIDKATVQWHRSLSNQSAMQTEGINTQQAVLKLIVTRGEGGKGYSPDCISKANRILQCLPRVSNQASFSDGVHLKTAVTRLSDNPNLAGIKHLNRLDYILAAQEVEDESLPLLLDQSGFIVESLHHNIFWVEHRRVCTPKLGSCGVDGVMRHYLFDNIKEITGLAIFSEALASVDCIRAKEVFICNSVRGIWPVVSIDKQCWPIGPITRKLQAHLIEKVSPAYAS